MHFEVSQGSVKHNPKNSGRGVITAFELLDLKPTNGQPVSKTRSIKLAPLLIRHILQYVWCFQIGGDPSPSLRLLPLSLTDTQNHPRQFFERLFRELICPSGRRSNVKAIWQICLWGWGVFDFVCSPGPYILRRGNWDL